MYADNTQFYAKMGIENETGRAKSIGSLNFNDSKTDVLSLAWPLYNLANSVLHIGDVSIPSSQLVRNFGVTFDQTMSMTQHISHICKSSFIQLRNIGYLKSHLFADVPKTLVYAFIGSRIYYDNSLLIWMLDICVFQLQRIHNGTVCLVTNTHEYDHLEPVLNVSICYKWNNALHSRYCCLHPKRSIT